MTTHAVPARYYITCDMCMTELEGSTLIRNWTMLTLRTERDYYMEDVTHHICPSCSPSLLAHIDQLKLLKS